MFLRQKRFIVVCHDCKKERSVGYSNLCLIRTNKSSGKCLRCANKKTTPTSFKKGHISWNKGLQTGSGYWLGKKRPELSEAARIRALKGGYYVECEVCNKSIWATPSQQIQKHRTCSQSCFNILSYRLGLHRGRNSGSWRGGITPINLRIRHSTEYKLWRRIVFERDDYTCQLCFKRGGITLNADHIKPFAFFPKLRFVLSNGRTLCIGCHKTTDTYGSKALNAKIV